MTLDILRKTGGWCVELQYPLKGNRGEVTAVEIRRPKADHIIRWTDWKIPSVLALLSELCDLPEALLRQLPTDDFDRVMLAFQNVIPRWMKVEIDEGKRPLATADELLSEAEQVPVPDQTDPRFPAATGPVVRFRQNVPPPPPPPTPPPEDQAMNLAPPATSEVVG